MSYKRLKQKRLDEIALDLVGMVHRGSVHDAGVGRTLLNYAEEMSPGVEADYLASEEISDAEDR